MTLPAGAFVREGVAYTAEGAMLVSTVGGAELEIAKWAVPFISISSGSIGNNGALSGVTALPTTYSGGAWVLYPANSIAAGVAAGWYWTVFSSTTAGTIYNSTYTSGVPGIGTTTAFVTTGPGAFTGTIAETTGPSVTIPPNTLGPNGMVIHEYHASANTGAGTKTYRPKFGGNAVVTQAVSTGACAAMGWIQNRGLASAQVSGNIQAIATETIVTAYLTVDTTAAVTFSITIQRSGATENAVLERGHVFYRFGA